MLLLLFSFVFCFQLPLHVVVDIRHLLIRKAAFARLEVLYTALETGIDELADLTYNLGNVTYNSRNLYTS